MTAVCALACSGPAGVMAAATGSGAAHKTHGTPASKLARLRSYPPKCLKQDGFGHIKQIHRNMWQGTTGEEPRTRLNDSAFVVGPFASDKLAKRAAGKAARTGIAYAGGLFIVTAKRDSYLEQETSLAAACLARFTVPGGYTF